MICRVEVGRIIHLRHRILRTGLPLDTASFPGDDAESTWHFAVFLSGKENGEPIGCASFMLNSLDEKPAWQLRGMATEPEFQKRGIGQALLAHAEGTILKASDVHLFWCNARVPAVGFYEKQGWVCVSEAFEIPTAGPHRRMRKGFAAEARGTMTNS